MLVSHWTLRGCSLQDFSIGRPALHDLCLLGMIFQIVRKPTSGSQSFVYLGQGDA